MPTLPAAVLAAAVAAADSAPSEWPAAGEKVRVTTPRSQGPASAKGYLVGMGALGAAGAGVGALAGLAVKMDRWERVPVDRVRVGIRPVAAGAGVQVSFGCGVR